MKLPSGPREDTHKTVQARFWSRPDDDIVFYAKILKTFSVVPISLGSGPAGADALLADRIPATKNVKLLTGLRDTLDSRGRILA